MSGVALQHIPFRVSVIKHCSQIRCLRIKYKALLGTFKDLDGRILQTAVIYCESGPLLTHMLPQCCLLRLEHLKFFLIMGLTLWLLLLPLWLSGKHHILKASKVF